ncbi:hypothetical protein [Methanoculleus sp.]|uniref:hypothetical protein n=2 Tax=Methanoculleus TaxID=45989 RepID=UPI00262BD78F|nr:hypothetical protein [Methanoculleus sp.]
MPRRSAHRQRSKRRVSPSGAAPYPTGVGPGRCDTVKSWGLSRECMSESARKVLRCPVCRSTEISWDARGLYATLYHCKQCGYQGAFILECDEDADSV